MWHIKIFDEVSLLGGFHVVPVQGDITSYLKALHWASSPQFTVRFHLQITAFSWHEVQGCKFLGTFLHFSCEFSVSLGILK